jgi:hypothetical protein
MMMNIIYFTTKIKCTTLKPGTQKVGEEDESDVVV